MSSKASLPRIVRPSELAAAAATRPHLIDLDVRDTIPNGTLLGVVPAQLDAAVARLRVESKPVAATPWQTFEDIGLKPKPLTTKLQKLVVSTYRLLGFAILTIIVVVLVGYIGTTAFYAVNKTWITPIAVSATDEKVVALHAELAAQRNSRDKLDDELRSAQLDLAAEQAFQLEYARAIRHDLETRRASLAKVKQLAGTAATAGVRIRSNAVTYARANESRLAEEWKAGLVDRNAMLASKYQDAQIASANLSLAERQAELDQRATELAAETRSLDAILDDEQGAAALSYDVLKIKRDYDSSKLALAKAKQHAAMLSTSLARQDQVVASLKGSAYLRAVDDRATIAFMPYDNLSGVAKGGQFYRCRLGMLWCRKAGSVLAILPGEVAFKHPKRDKQLRGQMVELQLEADEGSAAEEDVLFFGGKPLWW
ncbi:MAG: hypothetical protein ABJE66_11475 [Deltaproteobacteria bacterium]